MMRPAETSTICEYPGGVPSSGGLMRLIAGGILLVIGGSRKRSDTFSTSCPGLSRASTSPTQREDVDGWVKPGHDEIQLRGTEGAAIGGGPRPVGFFGFSVPA